MSILRSTTFIDIPTSLSVSELICDNVSNTPADKIIYEDAVTGKTATYGGFREHVKCSAYWLIHVAGFKKGDIVSISGPSCIDYIVACHAVWWAGGVISPINNSLHENEIAAALDLIEPSFFIIHDTISDKVDKALRTCRKVRVSGVQVMTWGKVIPKWRPFLVAITANGSKLQSLETPFSLKGQDSRKTLGGILLSSGTTGSPKAVMLSHYNLVAAISQLRGDNPDNWRGSQREIFFPPLSHVYALYVCITGCAWLGAYVCLMPRFDLELYCRLMQDRKATLARLVPPIAKFLAESPVVQKYQYPFLEYFSCSAAPLSELIASKLSNAFPGVALCQTYGATELSGPCVQSGVRNTGLPLSAAGTLIANIEMRFLDLDGKDVGMNGPGEITVRGPNVMMEYKDNQVATAEALVDGEWYRTGDLGYVDSNGFLTIYDRLKDIIKFNGFQVSPAELEEILFTHPAVDEAAVAGIWSEVHSSELPRAYVVLSKSGTYRSSTLALEKVASDISAYVSQKVSHYKQLRGGILFVERLPKNTTGKVLRRILRGKQGQGWNGESGEGTGEQKLLAKL